MQISCKLTNSILNYLQDSNEDIIPLLDSSSLSDECLQDPSYWMSINEAEEFLIFATKHSRDVQNQETALQWIEKIGHKAPQLLCWGVLDSVLRMMPQPTEVFLHAERFVSNFISSSHLIEKIIRSENGIEFQMPFSASDFPLVSAYIKACFESIPMYANQPMAEAQWQKQSFKITWGLSQKLLISEEQSGHFFNPKLVHSVLNSLEAQQTIALQKSEVKAQENFALKNLNKESSLKKLGPTQELVAVPTESLYQELNKTLQSLTPQESTYLNASHRISLSQNLSKLGDYMVRAQQLITLLVGQDRMNPSVKKAMDVVDWDFVKKQYPLLLESCREILMKSNAEEIAVTEKEQASKLELNHELSPSRKMSSADRKEDSHV